MTINERIIELGFKQTVKRDDYKAIKLIEKFIKKEVK